MRGQLLFSSKPVDTDVVVILVGIFHDLAHTIQECSYRSALALESTYATTTSTPFAKNLGRIKLVFAPFHAFSGFDATSQFSGKGKKSAWRAWKTYPAAIAGFTTASQDGFIPLEFTSAAFRLIRRFTCIMYDSTTSYDKVNDHRQDVFPTRVKMMEKLPPTETALLQHANRCLSQASIWKNSL